MQSTEPSKLQLALVGDTQIRLQRSFNASPELIFEAISKPEHIRNWWGCEGFEVSVCEIDFRPGGTWQIVQSAPDGQVHPFKGEILEIEYPKRVKQTFIYDVDFIRDHVATETMTLTPQGENTIMTVIVDHDSKESRDGHVGAGMESGAATSYNRLEALLKTISI